MNILAGLALPTFAWACLLLLELALALPLLYLLLLSTSALAASAGQRRMAARQVSPPPADPQVSTFTILVPAHNEEILIGNTLASLAQLQYPADRYAIHVIADNCTDRTAEIAEAAGAHVHRRTDTANRGKGQALAWALDKLMRVNSGHSDAYIVLDADTVVDPMLLQALARGLAHGSTALQCQNAVLNASESSSTALRWLALSLVNYIRPLGRNRLGGSSTLTGNGMCLTHELLTRHPWRAFGLSEDYQYYLSVVASGERVLFVPDARVYSVMPVTVRQLQSQDIRWETLSPDSRSWQRRIARQLLVDGIRHRDLVRLDALAELMTPPLSVLAGGTFLALITSIVLGRSSLIFLAAALVGALLFYVSSAFWLLRPPKEVYRALIHAPAYAVRKLWIYFVLRRLHKHTSTWVRTSRSALSPASEEGMPLETSGN